MSSSARKKSPRSPSHSLQDSIEKALQIYAHEALHDVPLDTAAKHVGYKGINSGSALSLMASLRYYGLVNRKNEGFLSVSPDIRDYKNAPDEPFKKQLRIRWLKNPAIFAELLEKYPTELPSDANLKFNLAREGFSDKAAEECVTLFRQSVEFAEYYASSNLKDAGSSTTTNENDAPPSSEENNYKKPEEQLSNGPSERIPVRLGGGRRAWLEIPTPFYERDKERLKNQIDLILSEDQDIDDLI